MIVMEEDIEKCWILHSHSDNISLYIKSIIKELDESWKENGTVIIFTPPNTIMKIMNLVKYLSDPRMCKGYILHSMFVSDGVYGLRKYMSDVRFKEYNIDLIFNLTQAFTFPYHRSLITMKSS